jgi:hypothetical protein
MNEGLVPSGDTMKRTHMKQSPLLVFESGAFPVVRGEDEQTNPGIYGKSLAIWLAEQLRSAGLPAGDVFAEDFGWCIRVDSSPHGLYLACAGTGEGPDEWRVFAFAEGGLLARLRGKDRSTESVATLFAAVRRVLESAPDIRGLREEGTARL